MPLIDAKRTVPARVVNVFDENGGAPNGIDAEPGDCQHVGDGWLMFACPGCGEWGAVRCSHPKRPETWDITAGTVEDATGLTLSPSVHSVSCCGWHGHLTAGVFVSC